VKTLYRTAHVKNDFNSFEREISTFKIVVNKIKKELEQILDENSYQIQLKFASELVVTQQVIFLSPTEAEKDLERILVSPS